MSSPAVASTLWEYESGGRVSPVSSGRPVACPPASVLEARVDEFRAHELVSVGEANLDGAISRLWTAVLAHHEVACPVCQGPMLPRPGAARLPVSARCVDCGATLS